MSRNSLSGKNTAGTASGARSSRASCALFKKLQKLDRKIAKAAPRGYSLWITPSQLKAHKLRLEKLDQQRKEVRELRKAQSKPQTP